MPVSGTQFTREGHYQVTIAERIRTNNKSNMGLFSSYSYFNFINSKPPKAEGESSSDESDELDEDFDAYLSKFLFLPILRGCSPPSV